MRSGCSAQDGRRSGGPKRLIAPFAVLNAARGGQNLRVVNDQRGSPTYTCDLAEQSMRILDARRFGTYHVTNSGWCTWYDLAARAVEWAGIQGILVTPVTTAEFPRPAPRPANSVLANKRLECEGLPPLRPWQAAVQEYIRCLQRPNQAKN